MELKLSNQAKVLLKNNNFQLKGALLEKTYQIHN